MQGSSGGRRSIAWSSAEPGWGPPRAGGSALGLRLRTGAEDHGHPSRKVGPQRSTEPSAFGQRAAGGGQRAVRRHEARAVTGGPGPGLVPAPGPPAPRLHSSQGWWRASAGERCCSLRPRSLQGRGGVSHRWLAEPPVPESRRAASAAQPPVCRG